jgi:asparagine synthase (glutamine-hydrolysing)
MCGIIGVCNLQGHTSIDEATLRQMLALLRHRGPDQFGIYRDACLGLGSARLSIIDLQTGQQPICNEDGRLWIVFNGEIFNYRELRTELEIAGHVFRTNSDTEVILHLYEEYGLKALQRLNGQFAFAIWDRAKRELLLARDRCGICPLFYSLVNGMLIFASEIKALLAYPAIHTEIDPIALDQIFSYWTSLSPRTIFSNVLELPPAHYLLMSDESLHINAYWELEFPDAAANHARPIGDYLSEFRQLLIDAAQIRLRADVPVGAYLSGGLDSSTIAAIIRNYGNTRLTSFSIRFDDSVYDESRYQQQMIEQLGTEHHEIYIDDAAIAEIFPELIWHTETAILRTAPAPMFLLSRLVQREGYKVVLTGEGADEFFAGYDIFKEAKIRHFWAKQPDSCFRSALLQRLYPHIPMLSNGSPAYLAAFFGQGLDAPHDWDFSHRPRWTSTARAKRFYSPALINEIENAQDNPPSGVYLPADFENWHPLSRAEYLEIKIFLPQYLLSSQGDRMAMAHSVEARFPFLDSRLIEFANQLPPHLKLNGLKEKYLLKCLAKEWLPASIIGRSKQAYRAPVHRSFFGANAPAYLEEQLSDDRLRAVGLFDATRVQRLLQKMRGAFPIGESEDMALAGILSTQILFNIFIEDFRMPEALSHKDAVKVYIGSE